MPEPRHVRVHVLHEGRASGDVTVEGFEAAAPAGWVFVDRAVLVLEDQRVRLEGGRFEVPFARVIGVEPLVSVSVHDVLAVPAGVEA